MGGLIGEKGSEYELMEDVVVANTACGPATRGAFPSVQLRREMELRYMATLSKVDHKFSA